eukprot:7908628-Lingulodinium_polyedra.AAC.1
MGADGLFMVGHGCRRRLRFGFSLPRMGTVAVGSLLGMDAGAVARLPVLGSQRRSLHFLYG